MIDLRKVMGRQLEPVADALRRLTAAQKALRILSGKGILLTRYPNGVSINGRAAVVGFRGAWHVSRSGFFAGVDLGFVNGIEPYIEGRPMSGMDDKSVAAKEGPPRVKLDDGLFAEGRSYIAIRAECDGETGRILAADGGAPGLTVVQVDSLTAEPANNDAVALHAVAMFRRRRDEKKGFGALHQISFFDLQHRSVRRDGRWRHFFDPA